MIAAGKRSGELRRSRGVPRRSVLRCYNPQLLAVLVTLSLAAALAAYCVWALLTPTLDVLPWRLLTILPFACCLLRYRALERAGGGETPEDLLLHDRPLQLAGGLWLGLFAMAIDVGG